MSLSLRVGARLSLHLLDVGKHRAYLGIQELHKFFLRVLVEVVLDAEVERKLFGSVAVEDNNSFLSICAQVDVYEEERLLAILLLER